MSEIYDKNNIPEEGTPEYDQFMRERFGDNYELGYRVGFGRRLGAALIDIVFTTMIYTITMFADGAMEQLMKIGNPLEHMMEISMIMAETATIATILSILYYSTEVLFGATPGKMLLRIKIANANRTEATFGMLFTRYIIKHLAYFLNILGISVSLFWLQGLSSTVTFIIYIGFLFTLSMRRQAFHDMLAGTAVFYKEDIKNY